MYWGRDPPRHRRHQRLGKPGNECGVERRRSDTRWRDPCEVGAVDVGEQPAAPAGTKLRACAEARNALDSRQVLEGDAIPGCTAQLTRQVEIGNDNDEFVHRRYRIEGE